MFDYPEIDQILPILQSGGNILYPTDTIWGLGCDALNAAAVERVFQLKRKPTNKSVVVLVNSMNMLQDYVAQIPTKALSILQFHTRPVTIIYEHPLHFPANVRAADESVGIRLTHDPFCSALIQAFGKPIISTSANFSGQPSPALFEEINLQIREHVDYVVSYRQEDDTPSEPSTIIRINAHDEMIVIRK